MIEQQNDSVSYLQFSQYSQFPDLIHGVFTRAGGYSQPPYRGLNTAAHPRGGGDKIDNAIRNRKLALQALALQDTPTITLWQVHGADVLTFDPHDEWRTDWGKHSYYEQGWSATAIHKGDALITAARGTAIAFSFADCVPIVFYDPTQQIIGIAHGGWRGTARGIALATVEAMQSQFGCQARHIRAGIGPAIGACCYEVSETVKQIFQGGIESAERPLHEHHRSLVREAAAFSTQQLPNRKSLRLDLQTTNRNQLLMAGLQPEQIEVMPICTSCNTERFFSHRAENGQTGRFVVIIALAPAQPYVS